jgi:5-methylcytosine-specific restriction endonuclease McrA
LSIIYTDTSFLIFDIQHPCPWLEDVAMLDYLIRNHNQIITHDRGPFLSRMLILPSVPPFYLHDMHLYYAAVKAVVHLQLYEGIKVMIAFANPKNKLDVTFNFTLEKEKKYKRAWLSKNFYVEDKQACLEAANKDLVDLCDKSVDAILKDSVLLTPYRDEHFSNGSRISIPKSWREFLLRLSNYKCTGCYKSLLKGEYHIDHGRPLNPEDDQCRPIPAGNTNIYNLAVLCKECNQKKSNKPIYFPERHIESLITNKKVRNYFIESLKTPPSLSKHSLQEKDSIDGQYG